MPRPLLPLAIAATVALAGCTQGDDAPVDTDETDATVDTLVADTEVADTQVVDTEPVDTDAGLLALANPTFDDPALDPGARTWTGAADPLPSGWAWDPNTTDGGSAGVARPTASDFTVAEPLAAPADGSQALYLRTDHDALASLAPTAVIASVVTTDAISVVQGVVYTATVAIGRRLGAPLPSHVLVFLEADGTTVRSTSVVPVDLPEGGFVEATVSWTGTGGFEGRALAVGLYVETTFSAAGSTDVWFDHVRLRAD